MKKIAHAVILPFLIAVGFSTASGSDTAAAKSQSQASTYQIGAGDILRIETWKENDFTLNDVLVRIDGKISFPLLNDVQAAGLTPLMLKDVLETGLKSYVANPVVTISIVRPESQKFYVLGEVVRTGEYPLSKDLTVMQAFALAGGFTQWATKTEILLVRREAGERKVYKIDYKDMAKGRNLEQDLVLRADDTIIVP